MIDVSKYIGQPVAGRVLNEADTVEILSRHPEIKPDTIPTYGIKIQDGGNDFLVGVQHSTGKVFVIFANVYDEGGQRLSEFDARFKALLHDVWKYSNYPSWWFSKKGSELGIDDSIIGLVAIGVGLWVFSTVKNILK
ncbi:MAG: hypothetical protein GY950_00805 [bacterium]|nr:hypothetical protein [bacterium]